MTYTIRSHQQFLSQIAPFDRLSPSALAQLCQHVQPYRYSLGQAIVVREKMPAQISILYEGKLRLLGYDPTAPVPITLKLLQPGELVGWVGLVRGTPCETAIASTEAICLTLPASEFLALLRREESIRTYFDTQPALIEVFDLLAADLERRADRAHILTAAEAKTLKDLALHVDSAAMVQTLHPPSRSPNLSPQYHWLISGSQVPSLTVGQSFPTASSSPLTGTVRLLGVPAALFVPAPAIAPAAESVAVEPTTIEVPAAPADIPEFEPLDDSSTARRRSLNYPYVRGRGEVQGALACFQMLARQFQMPFRRDVVQRVLQEQHARTGSLSLMQCSAIAELLGLKAHLTNLPVEAIPRIQAPALVRWHDSFALLYEVNRKTVVVGIPELGVLTQKTGDVVAILRQSAGATTTESAPMGPAIRTGDRPARETVQVLLLQPTRDTPQQKFGLGWFVPSLIKYRQVLLEVLIASFFVQLFGLANPLVTQVIIDKVLVQNSPDTLQVLGFFLVVIALFEAVLTSLRTYLFADTTNRIDLALGSEIIDHLLRLPLRYFERRPVGELATRVNELENIRQFLTGTALTVVLDAIFSVIYIVVMLIYSWLLTLVALATLPLFILLTASVSPIVRRQLRTKAERNATAQSYLVEVLSGIQTVKAQNIESRSRWQWQERYARYVSAGFKTVLTYTAASSTSNFLNQLSGLLILWIGAYLVLKGQLTLGQLIAFRIIAGYVTSPLLRLTQLWQNFQQTALSLERLSDILDTPEESDQTDAGNIPMPAIQGSVTYENVSFRFNPSGPLQLNNIHLEFPAGGFVGVVGQSGSGKSTLMKLLPRLYPLECGRILIDGYDINKVELYSLRRQIGIVPQDTLLFEGSVQENIALNAPESSADEIIRAAQVAAAHDFIMQLPNGYNTQVGERGSALSGGQRQRIAIARTILQNPRLLVLDEATSALDYNTERQVCLNLMEAFQDRTVFFITHRLSTIRNADHIVLLDQGSVVEQGTHDELMALQGRYYCLYQQQEAAAS